MTGRAREQNIQREDFLDRVLFFAPRLDGVFLRAPERFLAAARFFPALFFLPPPVSLLTVAHARFAAVLADTPRFL